MAPPGRNLASPQEDHEFHVGSTTTLYLNNTFGIAVLTKDDGGTFRVVSIDLAELLPGAPIAVVPFTGTRADGSTVTVTFTTDGIAGLETFAFSGFESLTSLSWAQDPLFHQFDNITLSPGDPSGKDECMKGGWVDFGFRNQGQCIRFVNTGKDSR